MPTSASLNAAALADLLETLVNIPSVTGNEAAIADWVAERLRSVKCGERMRSGNSVVWRGPAHGKPLVVLAGHLDTVPPNGNERARREDGKLYGIGTTDMKAGDAVMLGLLETLDFEDLAYDVAAVFYDAEEGPAVNNGLLRLFGEMPWLRDARLAILLEPTELRVELGCNGMMNIEVRIPGTSAHSARPWQGENAVANALDWLGEITKFENKPVTLGGAEFIETLQVTTVTAGRARNVVPDEVVVNLNHRVTPDCTLEQAEARIRALVPDHFGFNVVDSAPPGKVDPDLPEIRTFVERFGAKVAGKQGWTDVARFSVEGVAAFNFGPGIPELSHRPDEYCPIDNLETAYRWLRDFLIGGTS